MGQSARLLAAYQTMLERVRAHLHEDQLALHHAIERVAETAVELEELTREEAQLLSAYLKRDLQDAGQYLSENGRSFGEWLRFDLELVEERLLELFQSAADRTRLEQLALEHDLEQQTHYLAGEICGPGTLACENCGQELVSHEAQVIPVCPQCQGQQFVRVSAE